LCDRDLAHGCAKRPHYYYSTLAAGHRLNQTKMAVPGPTPIRGRNWRDRLG